MENYFRKCRLLPAMTLLGGLALASCVNSDYDFNEVDATMGFGGEGLELPGSSTDTIKLADVLDLGDDDCVKVRPNGDYVFEQVGDNVEPAQPEIAPISVTQRQSVSYDIDINVEPATRSAGDARAVTVVLSADGDMQSFEYDGDKPAEVVGLDYAETDANLSFSLHFPAGLSSVVASLDEISIQMPSFMELSDVSANIGADGSWSIDGSRIVFSNITTSRDLTVSARVSRLRGERRAGLARHRGRQDCARRASACVDELGGHRFGWLDRRAYGLERLCHRRHADNERHRKV